MPQIRIGLAGAHSGCGKTTAACMLLRELRGWGAIKCTSEGLYASVIDEPSVLMEEGKDTARMIGAGASEVLWVRASRQEMSEALELALSRMAHLAGVVVEGNRGVEVLNPDIVIFVMGSGGLSGIKPGAMGLFERADVLLGPAGCLSEGGSAASFGIEDRAWVAHVLAGLQRAEKGG